MHYLYTYKCNLCSAYVAHIAHIAHCARRCVSL
jgi:hypothetical protein